MSIIFRENWATVWEIKPVKGSKKVAEARLSTSRKVGDKDYANSNWAFVKFVSTARDKGKKLAKKIKEEGHVKILMTGAMSRESYEKDGEKIYPKNPQIVVWDFIYPEEREKVPEPSDSKAPEPNDSDEDILW